ncbi:MAG: hypothetical protein ACREB8_15660 [Pseudolabrys sp.]
MSGWRPDKSLRAGEWIIFPGRGRPPLRGPVFAGGFGVENEAPEYSRKIRKLLRAVVAFSARGRKK